MSTCFGQTVDKYIQVDIWPKFKKGYNINVNFGEDSTLFTLRDKTVKDKILRVKRYSNSVDALNYLGSLGWTLIISTTTQLGGNTDAYLFYFKKTFEQSELLTDITDN